MTPAPPAEAVVLAGGLGTRLRPAVSDLPKGLAPVAGRPFLEWQLAALRARGVRRAVMALGYRAEMIRDRLGSACEGVELDYSLETEPLGTGGALRQALARCREPRVLALNGDTFLAFNAAAASAALVPPRAAVMVLARVEDASRYGSVDRDAAGGVRAFTEKGAGGPGWINGGVYVLDRAAVEPFWPAEPAFSLERAVLPALAAAGRLAAVEADGRFLDIGTPADYARAQDWFQTRPSDS